MSVAFATNQSRVPALAERLGNSAVVYETFVARLASQITHDDAASRSRRYSGGCWCLEQVETEDCGTVFWWRLESAERFYLSMPLSGESALVDAELLSMVVCLMATSDLCIGYYDRGSAAERRGAPEAEKIQLSRLNEAYHDHYHGLRRYFLKRLRADGTRYGALLRLID